MKDKRAIGSVADKKKSLSAAATLRRTAEERLLVQTPGVQPPLPEHGARRLLHELQVHQIELELQNAELSQARDEAEAVLEKYTELFDHAPVGYLTIDRSGAIAAVNLSGAGLLGVERSRLIGRRFWEFVPLSSRQFLTDFFEKVCAGQVKESCEVALGNDKNLSFIVQIEAIAAASGKECRVALIDITDRRRLEEKLDSVNSDLAKRAAELAIANVELEAFNFTVSHDLRNPLTTIHGYCEVMKELCSDRLDNTCRGYIREISQGALRMSRLIDCLLNFSRVARVEMHRERVDLSAMANMVAVELKQAEPERRVTLRIADGIMADADAGLMRVVLDNLMGNAWKYSGKQEDTVIEFGMTERDGRLACFIRDNGPGFDMAHVGKLFAPFQRLPGTDVEGHGIGLATVERIISRHDGRIWAESEAGTGATFFFTMEQMTQHRQ